MQWYSTLGHKRSLCPFLQEITGFLGDICARCNKHFQKNKKICTFFTKNTSKKCRFIIKYNYKAVEVILTF